ncbi:uncharacterized protein LOC144884887 [Branchiostoma floridae x Branchiostoma japonicum]
MVRVFVAALLVAAAVVATVMSAPQVEKRGLRVGHWRVRGRQSPWIRYILQQKMKGNRKIGKRMPEKAEVVPNVVRPSETYEGKPNATDIAEDSRLSEFLRKLLPLFYYPAERAMPLDSMYYEPDN